MNATERMRDAFERVAGIDLQSSETVLSGIAVAAAIFLVMVSAHAAFRLWSEPEESGVDEMDLLMYLLRALLLLCALGAMMLYMKRSAGGV